ncbi:tetratricopeptide repeat protein [Paraburkholderia sediminicola]|uniref:tetratricopeptide repeat protein n=1 Tax=Paraburkholderia sediminicola TaxID=458836 RepID=UPI0038BB912B
MKKSWPAQANSLSTETERLRRGDAQALHRMALGCFQREEYEQASSYFNLALQVAPRDIEILEHAGLLAAFLGNYEAAETHYCRALGLSGGSATLHRNLADCLRLSGKVSAAVTHYEKSIEIEPGLHHSIRTLAKMSVNAGLMDAAAKYWLRAWELDSTNLQDGLDLIVSLIKAKRDENLATAIVQLRKKFGNDANALKALSFVLNNNDRFRDAINVVMQGLSVDPEHALLHHNAARAFAACGETHASLRHGRKAARLLPAVPQLQYQLANSLLASGEFEEGWKRYKAFYDLPGNENAFVRPPFPEWRGQPVDGLRFLMVGEQGRGDEIQCLRFADWLDRQGAIVDVLVSRPIAELARSVQSIRTVHTTIPRAGYDLWCHMLRMPEHMRFDLTMLPGRVPYVSTSPEKVTQWRKRVKAYASFERDDKCRIGIVWAGGPQTSHDRFRSIALDNMKPLFSLPGFTWFSLQKGAGERESEDLAGEFKVHTLGPEIEDFTDTLAILHSLHLLITVDTSAAHLAGAAGLPVWTLVSTYTEWRWLANRTDSPWYPSMRLFRQRELGQWEPVIEEVCNALREWRAAPV